MSQKQSNTSNRAQHKIIASAFLTFACTLLPPNISQSQEITPAISLARTMMDSYWKTAEQVLPTLMEGLKSQLRASGTSENASRVFSEEFTNSFSRENFEAALIESLKSEFSNSELEEIDNFLKSPAGRKYLHLGNEINTSKNFSPILRLACERTYARLNSTDASTLGLRCNSL